MTDLATRQFRVLKALGRGGFGTVYLAEQSGPAGFSKRVALKVMNPESESDGDDVRRMRGDIEKRLRDEARLLAALSHHAVVRVHELLRINGAWTVVMEYVEGASLDEFLKADRALPPSIALQIAADVASALDACWSQPGTDGRPLRILHRDIKPANVLVGVDGAVKVLDFGIAKADFEGREAHTRTGGFGSPGYVAPERFGGQTTPASDVYSLGVTLFEMLVGWRFAETILSERRHTAQFEQGRKQLERDGVPPGVADLLRRMMAFEPEDRPTVVEVAREARALARALHAEERSDWAQREVPPIAALRKPVTGTVVTGTLLLEDAGPASRGTVDAAAAVGAPPAARPAGPRWAFWAAGAAGIGVVALVALLALVGVVGALGLGTGGEEAPVVPKGASPEPDVADRTAVEAPKPAEAEPSAPSAAPSPVGSAPPESAKADVRPEAQPTAVQPAPATESRSSLGPIATKGKGVPAPSSEGTAADAAVPTPSPSTPAVASCAVSVTGDVAHVEIRGEAGTFTLPTTVPQGSYVAYIQRDADPRPFAATASIALCTSGSTATLNCLSATKTCRKG